MVEFSFSLLLVLAVTAFALYLLTVFLLARTLTRPPQLTDARALARLNRMSPDDLSLPFESLDFHVRDERTGRPLRLASWWIPHPTSDRCAILIHGYADAKIGSIAWAPLMLELGYNVLAIDLRAHGQSAGRDTTAGYFERHDISQVIDQLRALRPSQTQAIILFGISMGAAVAAATASLRDDIGAIILDSPYAHFREAARAHASLTGLPGDAFLAAGWKLAKRRTGADFEQVDPVRTIPTARCPVLVISATRDLLISPTEQAILESAIRSRTDSSQFWAQMAEHVLNFPADPEEYLAHARRFLNEATFRRATNQ
jgi:hypothetical protein